MKHQYKTEVFWKKIVQSIIDFFVDIYAYFSLKKNVHEENSEPKKILFIVLAQLGDALLMSYVFPFIRERFPNSKIDVLTGEWTKPILENNPYINNLIFFNHFRMNRTKKSFWEKIKGHFKSSRTALKSIRLQQYDLSIEGGVTHPNGNILTYRGGVKRRIGFGSGGFGSLLTDEVLLPARSGFHILEAVLEELKKIGIEKKLEKIKPYFTTLKKRILNEHPFAAYFNDSFILIHPESGNLARMLSEKFWLEVVQEILILKKYKIIICGTSHKSIELINFLLSNIPNAREHIVDAVQKLTLDELFLLSEHAKAAITAESLPAHLCAIACDSLSFYKNGSGTFFFPIPSKRATVIHNHLPSKESLNIPNCESIYVQNFENEETYALIDKFLTQLTT